jgi:hypothetical protein
MFEEYEKKKRDQVSMMRSIRDYGTGIFIIIVGLFFLFHDKIKTPLPDFTSSWIDKFFAGMCLVYGSWRIYRGYKKKYFR